MKTGSYQGKRALLIGNGINRLDLNQSFSWGDLLDNLKGRHSIDIDLDNVFKPFPLAFDELHYLTHESKSFSEELKILKKNIREEIENLLENKRGFNDYHCKLTSLPYDDILTTNYDYSLERSINNDFLNLKQKSAQNRQERKFSLKRCYKLNNKRFWHIHGELFDSRTHSEKSNSYPEESIMIGYEHYSHYLQKIQESIKGKSGTQKTDNQSTIIRIRNAKSSPYWTDIFFTHNLDIVGLGLDFSENHLWWIFSHRAKVIREENSKHEVSINNTIRFFYAKLPDDYSIPIKENLDYNRMIQKHNSYMKSKAIGEMLNAFMIKPTAIECKSYEEFYQILINKHLP